MTHRVPHPVLIGHAASLTPYGRTGGEEPLRGHAGRRTSEQHRSGGGAAGVRRLFAAPHTVARGFEGPCTRCMQICIHYLCFKSILCPILEVSECPSRASGPPSSSLCHRRVPQESPDRMNMCDVLLWACSEDVESKGQIRSTDIPMCGLVFALVICEEAASPGAYLDASPLCLCPCKLLV